MSRRPEAATQHDSLAAVWGVNCSGAFALGGAMVGVFLAWSLGIVFTAILVGSGIALGIVATLGIVLSRRLDA